MKSADHKQSTIISTEQAEMNSNFFSDPASVYEVHRLISAPLTRSAGGCSMWSSVFGSDEQLTRPND